MKFFVDTAEIADIKKLYELTQKKTCVKNYVQKE